VSSDKVSYLTSRVVLPVVYFIVMTSIVVHGITIPIGVAAYRGWNILRGKTVEEAPGSREMTLTTSMPVHKTVNPAHEPPTPSTVEAHSWPGDNVHASEAASPYAHKNGSGIELVNSKDMLDADAMSIGAASHMTHVNAPQKKHYDSMV
jgi:hypothetical protein